MATKQATKRLTGWTCPKCGRQLSAVNRSHSCTTNSVDEHFAGKPPVLRETYDTLISQLQHFAPLRTDAVKGNINLMVRVHLGGVQVQKDCLHLGFLLDQPIDDKLIVKRLKISEHKCLHHLKLTSPKDVDPQLLAWLKTACAMAK
ncbi:MAG: hypothetical protein EXR67_05830 [Dehalococcoidia bacterium]|nr:hypothetical protein [Dehalococcoidia bacterium]